MASDFVALALGGSPDAKRHVSNFLGLVGTAFLVTAFSAGNTAPDWSTEVGAGLVGIAWVIGIWASLQDRREAKARDMVEWGREAIELRRAVGPLWRRLDGHPYNVYANFARKIEAEPRPGPKVTFQQVVEDAGWPDGPSGNTAGILQAYLQEHFPPPNHESVVQAARGYTREFSSGRGDLVREIKRAKDIVEVWSIALDVGGSRALALKSWPPSGGAAERLLSASLPWSASPSTIPSPLTMRRSR